MQLWVLLGCIKHRRCGQAALQVVQSGLPQLHGAACEVQHIVHKLHSHSRLGTQHCGPFEG